MELMSMEFLYSSLLEPSLDLEWLMSCFISLAPLFQPIKEIATPASEHIWRMFWAAYRWETINETRSKMP